MKELKIGKSLMLNQAKMKPERLAQICSDSPIKEKIENSEKVIIKPNLVSLHNYSLGQITYPLAVDTIVWHIRGFLAMR